MLGMSVILLVVALVIFAVYYISLENSVAPTYVSNVLTTNSTSPVFSTPVKHIIIVVAENEEYTSVIGNKGQAPYENYLASKYALASEYFAVTHPSLPNYIALVAGSYFGISSDCTPSQCSVNQNSIVTLLNKKGYSWKEYAESMQGNCSQTPSSDGLYYPKHNPFVYFSDITGNEGSGNTSAYCKAHIVPLSQFYLDLAANNIPNYVFITPNMCNDGHDCSVANFDAWLSDFAPKLMNSSVFSTTILFIVYDEGKSNLGIDGTLGGGQVLCLAISPFAKTGYVSRVEYNHYSILATIESIYALGNLDQNDKNATVMQDLFTVPI